MFVRVSATLLCAAFASLFSIGHASAQASQPEPDKQAAYASDPKFRAAWDEAKGLAHRHQYRFAGDAYKKANKVADGKCMECLAALYSVDLSSNNFKEAVNAAASMEQLAPNPGAKSVAEYRQAYAIFAGAGEKPKTDKLEAGHALLQQALDHSPTNAPALYLDGQILSRLGRLEDAKTEFNKCVSCVNPKDPARLRAEHFAENPELSLHKMAPAFEVTAMDGSKFNLDAMGGRVVLIDFWATWCGPCNREIPHMKAIAKEFAGEPLVMISVSLDKDGAKWKDFVAAHEMNWVQYRDADGKLGEEFGVTTIPRYFTIDSDGVLTSVMVDEGSDVEGKLKKLIAKAHAAQRETVATAAGPEHVQAN
ncbi:MAG: redoxin family protein [Janthinobacterium lividum]